MRHPNLDDLWRACSYQDAWPNITVPALNITGWWDMNFPGAPMNFAGMRKHGQTRSDPRRHSRSSSAPGRTVVNRTRSLNGIDFGDQAVVNLDDYTVRFYDRWLKGIDNGIERDPRVHVFVLGANEWWTADDWPLPEPEPTPFYFHSNGHANSLKGDGGLSVEQPGDEPADAYAYDPADPVGAFWNLQDGPVDDRIPSIRDDMLCYTSDPLTEPLDVVGPVSAVLYASSSARDTDWHVRLVDVHPDGSARFLCHGMLRARFRESFEAPTLMEPERGLPLRVRDGRLRRPLPARSPHSGRGDEQLVPGIRPQHQLRRREQLHRRQPGRRPQPDLPRGWPGLPRRPPGRPRPLAGAYPCYDFGSNPTKSRVTRKEERP